jgi:membrane protease YdiL (CAAX protease family)
MAEKKNLIRLLEGLLFILMVLTGLFVHFSLALYNWLTLVVMLIVTIYFYFRQKPLIGPAIFFTMAFLINLLPFAVARLGLFYLIPLAIYIILLRIFPSLGRSARWFYIGRLDKYTWLGGLAVALLSALALYLWAAVTKPNLTDLMTLIPRQSLGTLILVGIGFAIANSFVEESIYRGILWTAFGKAFGSLVIAAILQSVIFGIAHLHGFPRGAIGVGMALIYGLLLGWIRQRSNGLLAPMIVHIVADIVLYLILLGMMGRL